LGAFLALHHDQIVARVANRDLCYFVGGGDAMEALIESSKGARAEFGNIAGIADSHDRAYLRRVNNWT